MYGETSDVVWSGLVWSGLVWSGLVWYSCASPVTCTNIVTDERSAVEVLSVQDGDTFRVRLGEKDSIGIRILGGDVFESRRGDRLTGQAQRAGISQEQALVRGLAAKEFARRILTLPTSAVEISRVSGDANFDVYGRLLRRVEVSGKEYFGLLPDSVKVK